MKAGATGKKKSGNSLSTSSKVKYSRGKKPKDMPRRPLSAYNIFFKEERVKMLAQQKQVQAQAGAGDGKVTFEKMAQTIGKRWKSLEGTERDHFKNLAKKDMERYREQMEKYQVALAKKDQIDKEDLCPSSQHARKVEVSNTKAKGRTKEILAQPQSKPRTEGQAEGVPRNGSSLGPVGAKLPENYMKLLANTGADGNQRGNLDNSQQQQLRNAKLIRSTSGLSNASAPHISQLDQALSAAPGSVGASQQQQQLQQMNQVQALLGAVGSGGGTDQIQALLGAGGAGGGATLQQLQQLQQLQGLSPYLAQSLLGNQLQTPTQQLYQMMYGSTYQPSLSQQFGATGIGPQQSISQQFQLAGGAGMSMEPSAASQLSFMHALSRGNGGGVVGAGGLDLGGLASQTSSDQKQQAQLERLLHQNALGGSM